MEKITVTALIALPVSEAWDFYTDPQHVVKWNHASTDWHCPEAVNDLRVGGNFSYRMEAVDGTIGFDFSGTYTEVVPLKVIAYTIGDRSARVEFIEEGDATSVVVTFDTEDDNPIEMQRAGWQAILDNYKKYAEGLK